MKIPKAKYHIGDAVNVRQKEAGMPPTYRGIVIGIRVDQHGELDYTILDDEGGMFDGYNETWLSSANAESSNPDREPRSAHADDSLTTLNPD